MAGDFPGEAQYYYEGYCMGGEEYDIVGGFENNKLYVKDGIALYVTGTGQGQYRDEPSSCSDGRPL